MQLVNEDPQMVFNAVLTLIRLLLYLQMFDKTEIFISVSREQQVDFYIR